MTSVPDADGVAATREPARLPLRACHRPGCFRMQHEGPAAAADAAFDKVCGGCGLARYCSPECQALHWRFGGHKARCRALQQGQRRAAVMPLDVRDCRALCRALYLSRVRVRNELVSSGYLAWQTWGRGVLHIDLPDARTAWLMHRAMAEENMQQLTGGGVGGSDACSSRSTEAANHAAAAAGGGDTASCGHVRDRQYASSRPAIDDEDEQQGGAFLFLAKPLVTVADYEPLTPALAERLRASFPGMLRAVEQYDPDRQVVCWFSVPLELMVPGAPAGEFLQDCHVTVTSVMPAAALLAIGAHRTVWLPDLATRYTSDEAGDRKRLCRRMRRHRRRVVSDVVAMARRVLHTAWSVAEFDAWFSDSATIGSFAGQTVVLPDCACSKCSCVTLKIHLQPPWTEDHDAW